MPPTPSDVPDSTRRDEWVLPVLEQLVSADAAAAAAAEAGTAANGSIWDAALRLRLVNSDELLAAISARLRTPIAPSLHTTDEARELLPEKVARRYHVVPLRATATTIDIATANPWDLDCERSLAFVCGRSVRQWLASPAAIGIAIGQTYRQWPLRLRSRLHTLEAISGEPVVRLVDRVVAAGIEQRASDIHLEPEEDGMAVRYRVDGILRHVMLLPKAVGVPLVSRIKIMARMDIADRLRPQGGRASVGSGRSRVDLRVSTLPASHGEKVVIRILDPAAAIRTLDSLGLDQVDAPRMEKLLESREGLVLVTGPTGSGKTTTLYAALKWIQQKGLNIITVEDPVEYRIPGIVQVQINEKAGLSFASALRSILRQDPDVVLIGEIRDRETAAIAIQASLTGHLVFATLHTNDACSSITRLTDLGVDRAKLAAALQGIVAQRLIRRLCPGCRIVANDGAPAQLRASVSEGLMVYTPIGCDDCSMTGYRGRLAVTEVVLSDGELERAIATGAGGDSLALIARRAGSRSLWDSGLAHLAAGETGGDELLRVLEQQLPASSESNLDHHEVWDSFDTAAGTQPGFDSTHERPDPERDAPSMTEIVAGVVDVYLIRPLPEGWLILTVQRAADTRCPGAWETIHGRLDEGERPEDGAIREVREETGLDVARLYNVTVQPFYLHRFGAVQLAVVFAAFVGEPAEVTLGAEHQAFEWLSPHDVAARFIWPREKEALSQILHLLAGGDAGPVEDVLRVR
ncbi:MAG TPA: ATPase, T2SS/T4P/T4SS family [Gemmatimonadaceae bacterium]|nr:ATPase, T2SS/T4P/T4SS family [Gemmatimonadaceae bacterium]